MTGDGPQGARIVQPRQGVARHRLPGRRLDDLRQDLGVGQRIDGRETLGFARILERLERDVAEHRHRIRPHTGVRIVAGDERQNRRVHQLSHCGPADASAFVSSRGRDQLVALVNRQRLDVRQPHIRIGMLACRNRAKSVEDCHGPPVVMRCAGLPAAIAVRSVILVKRNGCFRPVNRPGPPILATYSNFADRAGQCLSALDSPWISIP